MVPLERLVMLTADTVVEENPSTLTAEDADEENPQ
jgi:hypothetical protein